MKVIDPGHIYELHCLDGNSVEILRFVKRIGDRYPGNEPPGHTGTTMQEVLRALIERSQYVNKQIPCAETEAAIGLLKAALVLFEIRAGRTKGRFLNHVEVDDIVWADICLNCGHVGCAGHHATP